jgi:hypothetical protein
MLKMDFEKLKKSSSRGFEGEIGFCSTSNVI